MKRIIILSISLLLSVVGYADSPFVSHVTITTYNAVKEQTDDTPFITSDGTTISNKALLNGTQRIVAISRNLLYAIPLGSLIEIEGYGIYEVRDTMNKRYNHCIDILQHPSKKNFKKTNVKIRLLRKGKK